MKPLVFIVGCARSGTTLLQRIVNAHGMLRRTGNRNCTFWEKLTIRHDEAEREVVA
jgi:hypothetical protein